MTQENKELLLQDLCARLPFKICTNLPNHHLVSHKYIIHDINIQNGWTTGILDCLGRIQIYGAKVEDIKPYLRPMSSMTEEESKEFAMLQTDFYSDGWLYPIASVNMVNWLNKNHFDYRGLIEKGLAIEAPEGTYNVNEK